VKTAELEVTYEGIVSCMIRFMGMYTGIGDSSEWGMEERGTYLQILIGIDLGSLDYRHRERHRR
jgi:hypothetical protein